MNVNLIFEISFDTNPKWTSLTFEKMVHGGFTGYFVGQSFVPFQKCYDNYIRKIYGKVEHIIVHDAENTLEVIIRAAAVEKDYLEKNGWFKEQTGKETVAESIKSLFSEYGWTLQKEK